MSTATQPLGFTTLRTKEGLSAKAPGIDKAWHFAIKLGYTGAVHVAAVVVGTIGAAGVMATFFLNHQWGPFSAPALLIYAVFALGVVCLTVWNRYVHYCEQIWLGEVAKRVADAYELPWAEVAQVTRYVPLAYPLLPWMVDRTYTLSNRRGWGRRDETFRIVVPVKPGEDIRVERANAR